MVIYLSRLHQKHKLLENSEKKKSYIAFCENIPKLKKLFKLLCLSGSCWIVKEKKMFIYFFLVLFSM